MPIVRKVYRKNKGQTDPAIPIGRPPSNYGKKSTRSFYISDAAYDSLHYLAGQYSDGNVSELLELIARSKHELNLPQNALHREFSYATMFWRLRMLLHEPAGTFWSLLAFADRFASQVGLKLNEDELANIFLRAMAALFYLDYLSPNDPPIDSLSAWLRWILFHIIRTEANNNSESRTSDSTTAQLAYQLEQDRYGNTREEAKRLQQLECIATIYQARCNLMDQAISSPMNALRLRISHGYTLGQIEKVCRAQGDAYTGTELLKYGLDVFRKLWIHKEALTTNLPETWKNKLHKAFRYCELLQKIDLTKNEMIELRDLIKGGIKYLDHDNWAREIDYFFFEVITPHAPCIGAQKEIVRQRVMEEFDNYILANKRELDRNLFEQMPINKKPIGMASGQTMYVLLMLKLKKEIGDEKLSHDFIIK